MDLLEFSFSQYVFQCVLHSFIIALVIEVLLKVWHEERPLLQIRFRSLVILIPVLSFPVYQLIYPHRGSLEFRKDMAIFDINQWLLLRLVDGIFVWHLALVLLGVVAVIFVVQEAIPTLLHHYDGEDDKTVYKSGTIPKLDRVIRDLEQGLPIAVPRIFLLNGREPVIYAEGLAKGSINISRSLIEALDVEELQAVLAHEIGHVLRRDNFIGWVLFTLRFIMFYNPVVLIEFRKIINERETICDDLASTVTGKPLAIASGLVKVFRMRKADESSQISKSGLRSRILSIVQNLESHSQRVRIENRVTRMVRPKNIYIPPYPNIRLGITALSLILLLFFVV
ncbi:MAG: M56 family metallopeptidase [Thermodesulfobacteriota bacterium]